jgi:thiamine biosynthesis lipoprotein
VTAEPTEAERERVVADRCFGGRVEVRLSGARAGELAQEAIAQLHRIDARLSRFRSDSELRRVNRDPRESVPASPLLLDLVAAIVAAGERSGGLVDGTLLDDLERAGYVRSMEDGARAAVDPGPPPAPAGPRAPDHPGWARLCVDRSRGLLHRPAGTRLDSGGLGKGLAADRVGAGLRDCPTFCVDCAGDMRIGGLAGLPRTVLVGHPLTGDPISEFQISDGGVATSGTTRRSWLDECGRRSHHLIDPRTGEPARTGVMQVTALAPSATEAEVLAKAALLAGPERAAGWLSWGGLVVLEDGSAQQVAASQREPEQVG